MILINILLSMIVFIPIVVCSLILLQALWCWGLTAGEPFEKNESAWLVKIAKDNFLIRRHADLDDRIFLTTAQLFIGPIAILLLTSLTYNLMANLPLPGALLVAVVETALIAPFALRLLNNYRLNRDLKKQEMWDRLSDEHKGDMPEYNGF